MALRPWQGGGVGVARGGAENLVLGFGDGGALLVHSGEGIVVVRGADIDHRDKNANCPQGVTRKPVNVAARGEGNSLLSS